MNPFKHLLIILLSCTLFACQKEYKGEPNQNRNEPRVFGAAGDPDKDFELERGKPQNKKDTDRDGIPDILDECITQKENYNGYKDGDGCIDTIPVTPPPTPEPPAPTFASSHFLTMPPVIQQGSEGSCLSVSVVYARSYEAYKRSGATSYSTTTNILSPEFIFNRVKSSMFDGRNQTDCNSSTLIHNLNFVRDTGICLWGSMPYSWLNGCTLYPSPEQLAEAANFRIKSYSSIPAWDTTTIKLLLSQNRPLVSMITVDNGYYYADANFIWKTFTGAVGSHGCVFTGWDDSKHAFRVLNSWGTSWGDQGYSWIDYDFVKTISSSLFVMNF